MKNYDFDWLTDEFMLYCRSTQLREKTMSSYEQTLHLFGRWCADELKIYTVDKITENVIRKYIDDLQTRGKYTFYVNDLSKKKNYPDRRRDYRKPVSVTTINNYIRNIRVFFNWLERDYVIRKNPMRKIRQLKYNRQAKVFLSDEDLKKLLSKFDKSYFTEHRDYVMIMLMLDSGMRLGECSTLLVTDLELARKRINLRAEETKGRKDRTVYFSPKTESVLRRWLQFKDRYVESDYLFPVKEHGGAISVGNFETNFKRYSIPKGKRKGDNSKIPLNFLDGYDTIIMRRNSIVKFRRECVFCFGKNAFSALRSLRVSKELRRGNGAMRFSVRSFGYALFYEGKEKNGILFGCSDWCMFSTMD